MTEPAWKRRFRAPRVTLPAWARDDAERLLYGSNASGTWELYAWDRRADSHRRVTSRAEGTTRGRLDPAGEWIWWFDDRHGDELGRWVRQPFAAGESEEVAPELPAAYSAGLAIGTDLAVIGQSDGSGTRFELVWHGGASRRLYQHRESAHVVGLSRDEALLVLQHAEHGDSRHPALRVIDLEGRTVGELSDGPGRGLWATGWSPVGGDARVLVQHERADLPRPLIWDLERGQAREMSIDLPGEVRASWYPDASALLLVHGYRGRDELYRLDLGTERLEPIPSEPGSIGEARVRPDGELWYAWSSSSTPPEVRSPTGTVLRPGDEAAPGGVAYVERQADGVPIFVAEPATGARPRPTIFQVHGGPTAHDRDAFSPLVQAWVDHGFAVVLVNYRGSTGYGRAWRDGLEGNPGLTEVEDVAKARAWAVASGLADPERIVLAGNSWGGYITLLGLGTRPELWSLGIAGVPVADYVAAYEDEMEPLKAFDRALFGGSPAEVPEFYRERSPITYVDQVRVPVLILAGENDPRCPIRQIDNYLARLRELGKPHDVYRYQAGHGSLVVEETIGQVERQLEFGRRVLVP